MADHWDTNPDAWDRCILGKYLLPGVAEIDVKRGRKFDKKSAKGRNGATITDGGGEGAEVTISLSMTSAEEWQAFVALAGLLDPTKVSPQAYALVHPQAEAFGVKSVMVGEISSGPPKNGIYTVKIKCEEWFAAPKKGAKGKVTTPKTAGAAANILDMGRDKNLANKASVFDKASKGAAGPPPPSATGNTPTG